MPHTSDLATTAEPRLNHPDAGPYWRAVAGGELRVPRCGQCGKNRFYPRLFCPACGSEDATWEVDTGFGTIYSVTTVRMSVGMFDLAPPYQVALVDLDSNVRYLACLAPGESAAIGDRVVVGFVDTPDGPRPELRAAQ